MTDENKNTPAPGVAAESTGSAKDSLKERIAAFNCMELPGQQPIGMHMGTSYLVNDLWREVLRLRSMGAQTLEIDEDGNVHGPAVPPVRDPNGDY